MNIFILDTLRIMRQLSIYPIFCVNPSAKLNKKQSTLILLVLSIFHYELVINRKFFENLRTGRHYTRTDAIVHIRKLYYEPRTL